LSAAATANRLLPLRSSSRISSASSAHIADHAVPVRPSAAAVPAGYPSEKSTPTSVDDVGSDSNSPTRNASAAERVARFVTDTSPVPAV
jgi:hypothetical protein